MSRRTRRLNIPILMTTGVLGGGGALNISNPATDTFYTASANGTFALELTQPGSTLQLTRIGFYYRATTSSDAWFYYIERNAANTAWDLKRSLIQSGTPTVTTITTGVGTVAALRVTVSGTSHVFESSADGTSWTSRGSTTSAVHQTNTTVAAHYSGGITNLVTTPRFDAWTTGVPNGWSIGGTSGTEIVSEVANGVRIQSLLSLSPYVAQTITGSTSTVIRLINVYSMADDRARFYDGAFARTTDISSATIDAQRLTGINGEIRVTAVAAGGSADFVTREFSIYTVGALDDGGTTGPTRLYAS